LLSLKEKKVKQDRNKESAVDIKLRKRKKIITVSLICSFAAAFTVIFIFFFSTPDLPAAVVQSRFSMNYTVEVSDDPLIKVLSVTTRMDIDRLSAERMIYIYKSGITSPILSCVDDNGNDLGTSATTDLLSIGPIDESATSVTFKYDVMVGMLRNYMQSYGDFYEDLLVFSGENVFMSPYLDFKELKETEKYISSISFKLESNYNWKAIIPFQEPLSDDCSFVVEKPTWSVFSAINKSAYCFGQFEKQDLGIGDAVYFDKAIVDRVPLLSMSILLTFTEYYKDLFGELSPDAPLVLLRNSTENNAVILGGVGAKGAAVSIDLNSPDDCMTLSSTLFHLYFDSKIKAPNLRYPPNNWIYAGLANHHVLKSGAKISQEVRDLFSMTVVDRPDMDYLDYLYFSIKEPDFLAQNPSLEGSMDQVQGAYYMDVKVPVMIDLINYAIADTSGGNFITALLKEAAEEKDLDVDKFLKAECGRYYEAVLRCFSGSALIPNYKGFKLDGRVSDDEITLQLINTDTKFADLFSHGHGYIGYLSFPLILLEPTRFYQDVEARGVSYSSEEVMTEIKSFSSTLDQYLMQYAMFAKLAGYDTLTYENVKRMYTETNFVVWMEYCESIGFKD